jgi:hypothetical protein
MGRPTRGSPAERKVLGRDQSHYGRRRLLDDRDRLPGRGILLERVTARRQRDQAEECRALHELTSDA